MRADALQNRQRLLDAADAMFREHGIDVSVGEIADAAGVGRGTLFRNFRSKDHLIVAVVTARMQEALGAARELLHTQDDAEVVFTFIDDIVGRQQANRALMEAVSDEFFAHPEILAVHEELLDVLNQLLERGIRAGSIRPEIGAMDVLTLIKGVCMMNPLALDGSADVVLRHLELIRAAITTPEFSRPLRGNPPPVPAHPSQTSLRAASARQAAA